jgi:hypothetical protein
VINPWVIVGVLAALLLAAGGGYVKGLADNEATHVEAQRDGLLAYAERIKEVLENDETIAATNADLRNQLARMQHPHLPVCGSAGSEDVYGGLLYREKDAAFAELQRGDDEDFAKCDDLNREAIRTNALLK